MGWKSQIVGSSGAGLFQHLAFYWDAIFVATPEAPHTDGYLFWPEMEGHKLSVQIKSIERRPEECDSINIPIEPNNLRDWFHHRPLLVVCVISEHRAWWVDTADQNWPWDAQERETMPVELSRPVDATTKAAVQSIALRRSPYAPPFIIPRPTRSVADISSERAYEILSGEYRRTASAGIIERDVAALAIARIIHSSRATFRTITLERYLELVMDRLFAPEAGGRSFTLGALTALLRTRRLLRVDSSFIPQLSEAAMRAVTTRTFLTPEFGLVIAASLHDRFPHHPDVAGLVEQLVLQVRKSRPQNSIIASVADRLGLSLRSTPSPMSRLFKASWIGEQITRPLYRDDPIRRNPGEAEAATARAVKAGVSTASPADLELADRLIRLKASHLLYDWISHS